MSEEREDSPAEDQDCSCRSGKHKPESVPRYTSTDEEYEWDDLFDGIPYLDYLTPDSETLMLMSLFALVFIFIGWSAPVISASTGDASYYMHVHDFHAPDVNPSSEVHHTCLSRHARMRLSGDMHVKLVKVNDGGPNQEVFTTSSSEIYQAGTHRIAKPVRLPGQVFEPGGTYKYLVHEEMYLANGRVTRMIYYESNTFTASSDVSSNFSADSCESEVDMPHTNDFPNRGLKNLWGVL